MRNSSTVTVAILLGITFAFVARSMATEKEKSSMGYDITKTGLTPRYPSDRSCPPLTSLYASWDDVDGTRRDEPHAGVDGGRLGDLILAPATGLVVAVWKANWGWGEEQAVLLKHTKEDLRIDSKRSIEYFSEFDHLSLDEPLNLNPGQSVQRGQKIATVSRPGGNKDYLPEVHWEVWEVPENSQLIWKKNKFGGQYWTVNFARLVDPLYVMSLNDQVRDDLNVDIHPYDANGDYSHFRGFTYIFPCFGIMRDQSVKKDNQSSDLK